MKVNAFADKTVNLGYQSEYEETTSKPLRSNLISYTTDVYSKATPRWLWIHNEEREFHSKLDGVRSYSTPVIPTNVGDSIQFAVSFMSLMGVTQLHSIMWENLKVTSLPP